MSEKRIFTRERTEDEAFEGEVPELADAFFQRTRLVRVGEIIRESTHAATRGRPVLGSAAKVQQSLRLSPEVLAHFRSTGPGWQARIDQVLLDHIRMTDGTH